MRHISGLLATTMLFAPEGGAGGAPASTAVDPTYIAKLTLSRLCKPQKDLVLNKDGSSNGKTILMAEIYGSVALTKNKRLPNDDVGQALIGNFEGVNMQTGEILRSGVLYLPSGIQDLLVAEVKNNGENNQPVQFGLGLYIRAADPKSIARYADHPGWEWDAKKILETSTIDPIAAIRAKLKSKQPALTVAEEGAKKK